MKHLNPRQGITTHVAETHTSERCGLSVKHLNPRQGITTSRRAPARLYRPQPRCETPKSPPGDYNLSSNTLTTIITPLGVKHLNPRQGITTSNGGQAPTPHGDVCETPKSPPGDYNLNVISKRIYSPFSGCVKHLNPRQGITTSACGLRLSLCRHICVKHLNPRQGITTPKVEYRLAKSIVFECETPKSPPGDYNVEPDRPLANRFSDKV